MKTQLIAQLEEAINGFILSDDGRDFYIHETLVEEMATAAAAVYDACERGQQFAKQQLS